MCRGRRAEAAKNASNAAVLVVIIALLIVLYILMLPPDVRESLLGEAEPGSGTQPPSERDVLLSWVPQMSGPDDVEVKPLPFFTLRTQTRGDVLAERSGLVAERSVFHEESDTLRFTTPRNAQQVLLSFDVAQSQGRLEVLLNGEVIFDSAIERRQPEPIVLPVERLQAQNELEFRVSGVGFSFWQTNSYVLENVRVTADVTDVAQADHSQRFVVNELSSVAEAQLRFVADCFESQGRLSLRFNDNEVYSGFPSCGVPVTVDLPPSRLHPVENVLSWGVEEGEYIVDQIEVALRRENPGNQGRFTLSSGQLEQIARQGGSVEMMLSFAELGAQGAVLLNGEELRFRTQRQSFSGDITQYLRAGANIVEVRESSTPVALLEVHVR